MPLIVRVKADPPAIALFGKIYVICDVALLEAMVVGSFAVSLLVFVSPPPDTVAVLVTLAGALDATFTVSVIAG